MTQQLTTPQSLTAATSPNGSVSGNGTGHAGNGAALVAPDSAAARMPSAEDIQFREKQRAALRDLVLLAAECATTEAEIERRHQTALKDADEEFKTSGQQVEEQYAADEASVAQEYERRVDEVRASAEAHLSTLHAADRKARQRIRNEMEPTERDIKSKFDHAVWLAESVCEVANTQAKEEFKKVKELIDEQQTALDGMEAKAWRLLDAGGLTLPPDDDTYASPLSADPMADFAAQREIIQHRLGSLTRLQLPALFVGVNLYVTAVLIAAAAAAVAQWFIVGSFKFDWGIIGGVAGAVFVITVLLCLFMRSRSKAHIVPLRRALSTAARANKRVLDEANAALEAKRAVAQDARRAEVLKVRERFKPMLTEATRRRDAEVQAVEQRLKSGSAEIEQRRVRGLAETEAWHRQAITDTEQQHDDAVRATHQRREDQKREAADQYAQARTALEARLRDGLQYIQSPLEQEVRSGNYGEAMPWDDPAWNNWQPPQRFAANVRIGEMEVNLRAIAEEAAEGAKPQLQLPDPFTVPVTLGFPRQASLLLQSDREGRAEAIRAMQMAMARLLTSLPPGRVRFTIIDPVGLGQNFAGFMHLADHDEALVGGRIWTEAEHIEQKLTNLTEHMETVIQKYLRNEFETIDDYNAQAGELAEPYRFLVIADFPHGFQGSAYRRLASIASTGARCGVYTLITRDTRQSLPSEANLEELEAAAVNLVRQGERWAWKDKIFGRFPLTLDPPPGEDFLTKILDVVGRKAKEANRVEVPFDSIAPKPEEFWTKSTADDLVVPIGRLGATRLQHMRLGKGVAQHGLIAGKTGSGKSTLLHAIVTNLAMWYSPDEIEIYLIDFKKGVEFKTYATHQLPHARAIAVESDREFGLSVLQRLDGELTRRGEIFRRAGVQDLPSYRRSPNPQKIPRTLLVIDEFQEFFSEDDKLAQEAGLLLDRLVRQGRAFGIHLLLGSQTIGGTSGLARSTIGQMAVRVALQTSEADSHLILGDANSAARLLSRPGEAIYNDQGGLVEGNSPFQVAWLPEERREVYLDQVRELVKQHGDGHPAPVVFEGNAAADVRVNQRLTRLVESPKWPASAPAAPLVYLGEPVAIKEPTSIPLRRQAGANILIVGQQEESAMAMMVAAMVSLSAQHGPGGCKFYVLDGSPADSPLATIFPHLKELLPHEVKLIEYRAVGDAMNELGEELKNRQAGEGGAVPPGVYVLIYGLQRYRVLRKTEDSFGGFSMGSGDDDAPKTVAPDKHFGDLIREGPALGMHVIAWSDTAVSIDRTLDRNAMREFDNRVLFQMSANDSSNLIDSPAANKLGFHRALAYSEEQGVMEKFRPYGLPEKAWLGHVKEKLAAKQ